MCYIYGVYGIAYLSIVWMICLYVSIETNSSELDAVCLCVCCLHLFLLGVLLAFSRLLKRPRCARVIDSFNIRFNPWTKLVLHWFVSIWGLWKCGHWDFWMVCHAVPMPCPMPIHRTLFWIVLLSVRETFTKYGQIHILNTRICVCVFGNICEKVFHRANIPKLLSSLLSCGCCCCLLLLLLVFSSQFRKEQPNLITVLNILFCNEHRLSISILFSFRRRRRKKNECYLVWSV